MVQRHATAAFGESYAFPGGLVDSDDRMVHSHCSGLTASAANNALKMADNALDYFSAAVRELYEESGVLLARGTDGAWAFAQRPTLRAELREELLAGTRKWSELLQEYDLRLACESLHYVGHWETPLKLPKRFSTRFFVAAMPTGQRARYAPGELTDGRWLSAEKMLSLTRENALRVPYPTLKNLQYIAQYASLTELLKWAGARAARGIERIRPETIEVDGKLRAVLRGDPGYPHRAAE